MKIIKLFIVVFILMFLNASDAEIHLNNQNIAETLFESEQNFKRQNTLDINQENIQTLFDTIDLSNKNISTISPQTFFSYKKLEKLSNVNKKLIDNNVLIDDFELELSNEMNSKIPKGKITVVDDTNDNNKPMN